MSKSIYGAFRGPTFTECYPNVEEFMADYEDTQLPKLISDDSARTLYYILYAYYGNSVIAASDLNRFRYNLFSIIWQYGPTWEKRLEVQAKLRALSDDEIRVGAKQIANHAFNPSTEPSTAALTELEYIDSQNTMGWVRSKLEGYGELLTLLDLDVSAEFLGKFKRLFITIVEPEMPLLYSTEDM